MRTRRNATRALVAALIVGTTFPGGAWAQSAPQAPPASAAPVTGQAAAPNAPAAITPPVGVKLPEDYVIGAEDILSVFFWREKDMSGDVVVRPDGRITLPLMNDIEAAGLTPELLRQKVEKAATQFIEDPSVTIVVKQINSRKVFITGEIERPGPYNLTGPLTVVQLIAMAGGLREYARRKDIVIMRTEGTRQITFDFNYVDVTKRTNLKQNILLKPGDTIIVP